MSDYVPFEIQVHIIERLPVKSLIRCRSVSKAWKSLIDSSEFVTRYSVCHTQPQHLLIRYHDPEAYEEKYVSFVDDETFPQQKYDPTLPLLVKKLYGSEIVGSCQGLLCLHGYYVDFDSLRNFKTHMAVLWNPSIRKLVAVAVPKVLYRPFYDRLGFGVCPGTSDPKIIICRGYDILGSKTNTFWQVKVFTLSSGAWRNRSSHLPRKSIDFKTSQAVVDRFLYWSATDIVAIDGGFQTYNLIMSFDLINDEFTEVYLPDSLALDPATILFIFKLRESLAVIEISDNIKMQGPVVWVMEDGVPKSFKKLFNINTLYPSSINNVLGFRNTGEPILEVKYIDHILSRTFGFAVYSEHCNHIGIYGTELSFSVNSYMETLLLLNAPDYLGIDEVGDDDFLRSV